MKKKRFKMRASSIASLKIFYLIQNHHDLLVNAIPCELK